MIQIHFLGRYGLYCSISCSCEDAVTWYAAPQATGKNYKTLVCAKSIVFETIGADSWMDGWMDRWMDGWMDGWYDQWSVVMGFSYCKLMYLW